MTFRVRRALAVLATVLSTSTTAVALSATASADAPTLNWHECYGSFLCAQLHVPLDYDDPNGAKISLALIKQPATDPAHRIGSLFVNPGGPGGTGVEFILEAGSELFTPAVRARFDLIGFDPRGIVSSTPLRCFGKGHSAGKALSPFPYPNSAAKRAQWFAADRYFNRTCAQYANPIIDHMSTADTARDLDQMRAAVGDAGLTYYGVSYGSYLGDMYANLFPSRVRSLVIDGVLDPVAWATGHSGQEGLPFSSRLHSSAGAQKTLNAFFRLCDAGGSNCSFGPNAEAKYYQLYRTLAQHPLFPGSRQPYDESFLVSDSLGAMYDSSSWPEFADLLTDLRLRAHLGTVQRDRAALRAYAQPYFGPEGFYGVACSDSINPQTPASWIEAAAQTRQTDGVFGPIWTWASSTCAHWPGSDGDRYLGPFNHRTANPVLVVGNLSDPATPYQGAQVAARLLPNSTLLTVHGWGHTSLFLSRCADQAIGKYLLTSQTPAAGTVCNQDDVPFQGSSPAARVRPSGSSTFPRWTP